MSKDFLHLEFDSIALQRSFPLSQKELEQYLQKCIELSMASKKALKIAEELGPGPYEVGLRVVATEEMREFQRKYRNLDRSTDVLSFSSLDSPDYYEEGYLGDVVICLEVVQRNANRYGRPLDEELARVWIHSIFHLCGFDHVGVSAAQRAEMRKIEAQALSEFYPDASSDDKSR